MLGSLLRNRTDGKAQVGVVELFFDLVFVFAVTQVSHTLAEDMNPVGAVHAAVILAAIWWSWVSTTWATNFLDPEHQAVRLVMFLLMAAGLVLSTSIPEAFGEKGWVFATAYVCFQVGRGIFLVWATRAEPQLYRNFLRVSVWLGVSGGLWIAGGASEGPPRLWFWLTALAIDYIGPALSFRTPGLGRSRTTDWNVEGRHTAERVGLFIIICLGESILVTGATFAELMWTPEVVGAFAVAFLGTVAMWWIYFSATADAASDAISDSDDPGRIARQAFTYAPVVLVAGIVVTAVGDELSMGHPEGPMDFATASVLIGGPLLFLAGAQLMRLATFGGWSAPRGFGIAALVAITFLIPWLTPLSLAACATGVLIAVAAWESMRERRGIP